MKVKLSFWLISGFSWTLLSCQLLPSFRSPDSLSAQGALEAQGLEGTDILAESEKEATTEALATEALATSTGSKKSLKSTITATHTQTALKDKGLKKPQRRSTLRAQFSNRAVPTPARTKDQKENYVSAFGQIQIDDNEQVDKWINYFQTAGREKMALYLSRSTRYLSLMKEALREAKLPEDLVYVAMIESGFSPYAHSFANAVGYWQFIEGTARRYGLKVNSYIDERRDPILATRAAARYFKDLYNVFTSWPLALASYNAGEYRVHRSVLRYYTKDFWFLSAKRALPRETANYVPKFMAALQIGKSPEKYGFDNIQYQEPFQYDKVHLKDPISLKTLAKNLSLPYEDLRRFNPRYRSEFVPIDAEQTFIRVPKGTKNDIVNTPSLLASAYMKKPPFVHANHYWYRVRRGDTLYRLARRNKTRVSTIRRMNKMGRRSFLRAGRKIKLPYYSRSGQKTKKTYALASSHTVQRGENLSSIASRYKVSARQIRKINSLTAEAVIHPGQVLKLTETQARSPASGNKVVHIVQRGETLIGIAKKYQVSLPSLMKKNGLSFKSILATGRHIIIPSGQHLP